MGALKSFVELKRSGEDEIEQKEPLLHKPDLLKTSGYTGNKQRAVSASGGHINAARIGLRYFDLDLIPLIFYFDNFT